MKYLKHFESRQRPESLMIEYQDDIINVLSKYHERYDDNLTQQIDELLWECEEASERYDEIGTIDSECIRIIIENLKGAWDRHIQKLLDIYYDCRGVIKSESSDLMQDIKDIFADYEFIGKVNVRKSADRGDDRYVIDLNADDVLLKLDFNEVISRIKQITGLENISYNGTKDSIRIEFYKDYENSDDDDD